MGKAIEVASWGAGAIAFPASHVTFNHTRSTKKVKRFLRAVKLTMGWWHLKNEVFVSYGTECRVFERRILGVALLVDKFSCIISLGDYPLTICE